MPQFQSVCWDAQSGDVLAEANTVPCWWDGTDDGLGSGIDQTMIDAFARLHADGPANALCALAGTVAPGARARGFAAEVLRQMRQVAASHGLSAVIAPVRPPLPRSLRITGSVADWEAWTELPLPVSGSYVFPEGLAPLEVDRDTDRGEYWEPNIWFVHRV